MAARESFRDLCVPAVESVAPTVATGRGTPGSSGGASADVAAGEAPRTAGRDRAATARYGVMAGIFGTTATAAYAATANSVALWADLAATVLQLVAVLTAWLTLRKAARGPSEAFSYGHGRLESFAGFGIGQLMLLSAVVIIVASVWRTFNASAIVGFGVYLALGVNAVSLLMNGYLYHGNRRLERSSASATVTAQRRLYLNKVLLNAVMVTAMGLSWLFAGQHWIIYIDPALSMFLGVSLLLAATKTVRFSAVTLVDRSLEERAQLLILRALAEHYQEYEKLHGIRTRMAGTWDFVEVYLEFDATRSMGDVQSSIDRLQQRIRQLLGKAEVMIIPATRAPAGLG
jgi:cation diffusion facilitator family transporter